MIHSGNPGQAVQASSSIPGAFVPVEHQGDIWVDGGVFSVIPVYTAKKLGAKKVIAIDIYYHNQPKPTLGAGNITLTAFRMQSCRLSADELNSADVVIAPNYEPPQGKAFDESKNAIQAGYLAAQKVMPAIKKLMEH